MVQGRNHLRYVQTCRLTCIRVSTIALSSRFQLCGHWKDLRGLSAFLPNLYPLIPIKNLSIQETIPYSMWRPELLCLVLAFLTVVRAEPWPYNRVVGDVESSGKVVPNPSKPDFGEHPDNLFVGWLRGVINANDNLTSLQHAFVNGTIPDDARWFTDVLHNVDLPANYTPQPIKKSPFRPNFPHGDAQQVFSHLHYPLDSRCTVDRSRWCYRTADGSCNWLKKDEFSTGATGMAKVRDYNQYSFTDGVSKPRDGPNARAVSNAFFKRNQTLYYEHTPLLLGLI